MRASRHWRILLLSVGLSSTGGACLPLPASQIDPDTLTVEEASEWLESNLATYTTVKVDSLNFEVEMRDVSVQNCHLQLSQLNPEYPSGQPLQFDVDLSSMHNISVGWRWRVRAMGYPEFPSDGPVDTSLHWGWDELLVVTTKDRPDAELLESVICRVAKLCGSEVQPGNCTGRPPNSR